MSIILTLLTNPLVLALIGVMIVANIATGLVQRASEGLPRETRDRIEQAEVNMSRSWRAIEWLGLFLIALAMFLPQMILFTAASQRVLTMAAGLMLFGSGNTCSAWFSFTIYRREAADSDACRASLRSAILVTLAESVLIAVIVWVVAARLDMFPGTKIPSPNTEAASGEKEDPANWIDESLLKKELAGTDRDYIQGLVDSGKLRTKKLGDKTMFRMSDVLRFKNKPRDNFE